MQQGEVREKDIGADHTGRRSILLATVAVLVAVFLVFDTFEPFEKAVNPKLESLGSAIFDALK